MKNKKYKCVPSTSNLFIGSLWLHCLEFTVLKSITFPKLKSLRNAVSWKRYRDFSVVDYRWKRFIRISVVYGNLCVCRVVETWRLLLYHRGWQASYGHFRSQPRRSTPPLCTNLYLVSTGPNYSEGSSFPFCSTSDTVSTAVVRGEDTVEVSTINRVTWDSVSQSSVQKVFNVPTHLVVSIFKLPSP